MQVNRQAATEADGSEQNLEMAKIVFFYLRNNRRKCNFIGDPFRS